MKKPDFKMPSVTLSSVTGILKPKPVFNRPVATERKYELSRLLYTVLLSKLVLLSTAVIVLKAMTLNFIEDNINTAFSFDTGNGDPTPTALAALPTRLQ